jgi:hypothetical protein
VPDTCSTKPSTTVSPGFRLANQQRWATLAVSALGVNLPRLALLLRGIGDEAAIVSVARDARSDLGRMLERMAQAHALCTALQNGGDNPRADLVGCIARVTTKWAISTWSGSQRGPGGRHPGMKG